jgi:hypothetical protein
MILTSLGVDKMKTDIERLNMIAVEAEAKGDDPVSAMFDALPKIPSVEINSYNQYGDYIPDLEKLADLDATLVRPFKKSTWWGFDRNLHQLLDNKRSLSRAVLVPAVASNQDLSGLYEDTFS